MSTESFSIQLASVPDRELLVAELWYGEQHVAELMESDGAFVLQLFSPRGVAFWTFSHDEFVAGLQRLKERLTGAGG